MKNTTRFSRSRLVTTVALAAVCLGLVSLSAMASGPKGVLESGEAPKIDDRPDPLSTAQRAMRQQALQGKISGASKGKAYGHTHAVAKGQYVELAREGEDPIWTVLGEFSDYPHNSLGEPDRDFDNTTIWTDDFSPEYYLDLLFDESRGANSMRNYYIEQSSNRFTVFGDVTDWI